MKHYILLSAGSTVELNQKVSSHLSQGYQVHGSPFSDNTGRLHQAVVK